MKIIKDTSANDLIRNHPERCWGTVCASWWRMSRRRSSCWPNSGLAPHHPYLNWFVFCICIFFYMSTYKYKRHSCWPSLGLYPPHPPLPPSLFVCWKGSLYVTMWSWKGAAVGPIQVCILDLNDPWKSFHPPKKITIAQFRLFLSAPQVDRPTQMICICICIFFYMSRYKYKRNSCWPSSDWSPHDMDRIFA